MLFESTRMKTQTFCKQKTASVSLRRRFFYGRGWITQAALLKTAHRAVFAPSSATGPQLFESARLASGKVITKQKLQYPVRILEFLVGAGGFEPPKLKAADLQSVPIGHSGTRPDSVHVRCRTTCLFYQTAGDLSTTFFGFLQLFCGSCRQDQFWVRCFRRS